MRDDTKIVLYKEMRENARRSFMETGNRNRLVDMVILDQEIEKEMNKETRVLGRVLFGILVVTVLSPFISYFFIR